MKALILNSGMGTRMGVLTKEHPKCMTDLTDGEAILSRQLRLLAEAGICEVILTTGYFDKVLVEYCNSLKLPISFQFVYNPLYAETNYIYSIYCAREFLKDQDILLLHGDLVFDEEVLQAVLKSEKSCMVTSSTVPLPEKDFKAVLKDGRIEKVGVSFFDNAVTAQPLYKIFKKEWNMWLDKISAFCEADNRRCYAENAFNEISETCHIYPMDVRDALCCEVDMPEDLEAVLQKIKNS